MKIKKDFDFSDSKINGIHKLHNYPAMLVPEMVEKIIEEYAERTDLIFDPFGGSGTVAVCANKLGHNAISNDINPLARFITKVKTTKLDLLKLTRKFDAVTELLNNTEDFSDAKDFLPERIFFENWYTKEVLLKLSYIKEIISKFYDSDIKDFFMLCFLQTARKCSLQRQGEFKMYKISPEKRKNYNPDAVKIFLEILKINFEIMKKDILEKENADNKNCSTKIINFRVDVGFQKEYNNAVDLVITSPPYGDTKTTVAYEQFSRFANEWLEIEEATKLHKKMLGGTKICEEINFGIPELDSAISQISSIKRRYEVAAFYLDYRKSILNISKILKRNGKLCFVVANRRVGGIILPTDLTTIKMFEQNGFELIDKFERNIHRKRMPLKNSPMNQKGKKQETMLKEHIIIMKKK